MAGGYRLMLLALFLAIVDGCKVRRGLGPFLWIGMNPITLYLSHHFINYTKISTILLAGPVAGVFGVWSEIVIASGTVRLGIRLA